ncbi:MULTISPECIES: hypothetical protein [Xanthomonas]|uniref:hypothetical protein n=1 Tax=Xanthomonas TaxID=338 RepID=UPI001264B5D2|nr:MULTISPECIES: hypothetical protein [Xanthomonas]KAB7779368.1 hypothetical protein CEK66_06655 [Xanthomonas sp. LMG 12460]MCW0403271.1 hypothetical protein [Xanthomonas sacchari]MCW0414635.1 hypothetical protein [Xanthomonas sacchari]MCW0448803.1 hypothetical protein [Xanthomonas sacchari]MCW0451923.1 hypothetical protein [Xanthomonas sacchari]
MTATGRSSESRVARWFFAAAVLVFPAALLVYFSWRSSTGLADSYGMGLMYCLIAAVGLSAPLALIGALIWAAGRFGGGSVPAPLPRPSEPPEGNQ